MRKSGGGDRAESRIAQFTRIQGGRLRRRAFELVNKVICTKCWHPRKNHWEMGDEFSGPIDWGCKGTEKNGKYVPCDC